MQIDDEPFVPRRRVSVDRPTEPTYPWRKPSLEVEVDDFNNNNIDDSYFLQTKQFNYKWKWLL